MTPPRWLTRVAVAALVSVSGLVVIGSSVADASSATTCSRSVRTDWSTGAWHHNSLTGGGDVDWTRFRTAAASWTMVTLGGLTGDLSLSLYDANCHRLATSQHGGRRYEEIDRSLPAGRYYVGITGAAGSYDLRFRTVSAGTHVLSSRAYKDADGQLIIAGEVLNNRGTRWFLRDVATTFYNRSGQIIGHDDGTFPEQIVAAHQRRPFFLSHPYPRGFDHYRMIVSTEAPGSSYPNPAPATVQRGATWRDGDGHVHYPGAVRNGSRATFFGVWVVYTLYDSHGRVRYVNEGELLPEEIMPSASGGYDVTFDSATGVQALRVTVTS